MDKNFTNSQLIGGIIVTQFVQLDSEYGVYYDRFEYHDKEYYANRNNTIFKVPYYYNRYKDDKLPKGKEIEEFADLSKIVEFFDRKEQEFKTYESNTNKKIRQIEQELKKITNTYIEEYVNSGYTDIAKLQALKDDEKIGTYTEEIKQLNKNLNEKTTDFDHYKNTAILILKSINNFANENVYSKNLSDSVYSNFLNILYNDTIVVYCKDSNNLCEVYNEARPEDRAWGNKLREQFIAAYERIVEGKVPQEIKANKNLKNKDEVTVK